MVLQGAPQNAIIWGYCDDENLSIRLKLHNQTYYAICHLYVWSIKLDIEYEQGPFEIIATEIFLNKSQISISINDILFGDVWLCSGGSNMAMPVKYIFNGSNEIENASKYPKIRLLTVSKEQSMKPEEELKNISMNWTIASSLSVGSIYTSAVCWLYGRMIHLGLDNQRPIGLIHTSWNDTFIEMWSPFHVLKDCNVSMYVNLLKITFK